MCDPWIVVIHGFSACGACFQGFLEKDTALAKSTFDRWMPQIEGRSGSVFVVQMYVVLELVGDFVCGHDGLTKSRMFVRVVIRAGDDTNGSPFGCLLCPLI
jgi:hypothetical protein